MFVIAVPTFIVNLTLFLVRLVLVVTFTAEARMKFKDLKAFAKADGIPVAVAGFVAVAEMSAALGMLTGVLAQWAGIGIVLLMMATISMHVFKWHSPYWANQRGWEYDVLMLVLALVIVTFGAGDFVIFG